MKRLILIAVVLLAAGNCEAGQRRMAFKEKKLDFKQAKLASGVTLYRAKAFYHWGKTANNVTGFINPVNWVMGAIL